MKSDACRSPRACANGAARARGSSAGRIRSEAGTAGPTAAAALPTPATYAVLRRLKAGETVRQTLVVTTSESIFTLHSLSDGVSDT